MPNRDSETSNFLTNMRKASIHSSLWVFVLLSMLFRDVHEIPKKEFIEDALNRTVPDELFLIAGIILAMPILMAPLSKLLPGPHMNENKITFDRPRALFSACFFRKQRVLGEVQ